MDLSKPGQKAIGIDDLPHWVRCRSPQEIYDFLALFGLRVRFGVVNTLPKARAHEQKLPSPFWDRALPAKGAK